MYLRGGVTLFPYTIGTLPHDGGPVWEDTRNKGAH